MTFLHCIGNFIVCDNAAFFKIIFALYTVYFIRIFTYNNKNKIRMTSKSEQMPKCRKPCKNFDVSIIANVMPVQFCLNFGIP